MFVENSTTQLEMVVENRALGVKKSKLQHFPEVGTLEEGSAHQVSTSSPRPAIQISSASKISLKSHVKISDGQTALTFCFLQYYHPDRAKKYL